MKRVFEIDGIRCDSLEHFYDEVTRVLGLVKWGRNLDAFNDILRGGFGTPEGGFVLQWRNSEEARRMLGFPETLRYLAQKLTRCHPTNIESTWADIAAARRNEGQTLFDILVEIIRDHGQGGTQASDGVDLELV